MTVIGWKIVNLEEDIFMKLNVEINDFDFAKLGLNGNSITFDELKEKLSIEYAKESLIQCNEIAEKTGLSKLSMEEINAEIATIRNAKDSH